MPIFILSLMWLAVQTQCTQAHAMTRIESKPIAGDKLDLNQQLKQFVCSQINCPEHIRLDELKISGRQFASARISIHYHF